MEVCQVGCSDQCDQIWRNFATWAKLSKYSGHFLKNYLVFAKILNILGQSLYAIGQIVIVVTGNIEQIIYSSGHTNAVSSLKLVIYVGAFRNVCFHFFARL